MMWQRFDSNISYFEECFCFENKIVTVLIFISFFNQLRHILYSSVVDTVLHVRCHMCSEYTTEVGYIPSKTISNKSYIILVKCIDFWSDVVFTHSSA